MLGTSPSVNMGMASVGQSLLPGEIVKNSGKFSKPTKIPGKNYSKDEIIIRNADSGKGECSSPLLVDVNLSSIVNKQIDKSMNIYFNCATPTDIAQ